MKGYIASKITAVYVTDAEGVPTQADILDWQGLSLVSGQTITPPNAFATNQWSLATGSSPREITINVSVLPANNGAEITGIEYSIDGGAWVALTGVGTGPRTITAAAAGTSYEIRLRSRNLAGASDPSAAKTVTSGAPAATAPAAFAAGDWTVMTGTGPAEIVLDVTALPSTGGSALTALEYRVGAGAWTALTGTGTGARTLTMAAPGTSYSINIRAVNAIGSGPASTAKSATSGAAVPDPALTAALSPNPPVAGELLTITFSAAPDSVSATLDGDPLTISGSGTSWTVTIPPQGGDLVIDPEKDGYTSEPITFSVVPVDTGPENPLAIVGQPDSTFTASVGVSGMISVEVAEPADMAGTYTVNPADVTGNVPPHWVVDVSVPASVDSGDSVTANHGFCVGPESGGPISYTIQWRDEAGVPVAGATGLTLTGEQTLEMADEALTVRITATNTHGSSVSEATVEVGAFLLKVDTFDRDVADINGEVFESGEAWTVVTGGPVRTSSGSLVSSANSLYVRGDLDRGPRQYAKATVKRGGSGVWAGVQIGICIAPGQGYFAKEESGSLLKIIRLTGSTNTTLAEMITELVSGDRVNELERLADGTLNLYQNGTLVLTANDGNYSSGGIGFTSYSSGGTTVKDFAAAIIRPEA